MNLWMAAPIKPISHFVILMKSRMQIAPHCACSRWIGFENPDMPWFVVLPLAGKTPFDELPHFHA
jgi:hypothetical protein